ncbi:ROK family protein [Chelativorans sp. YIM 93263]|uniref:ROK family protein n=1 Tax=Chelativorans sp. YIM 93263 TaxID=2906648 RepID=UPI002379CE65|nr:ROK family protein [Chelativorans sp. YIM 93263]
MVGGIRHYEMRKRNRALVISAVRKAGQCSRTQIARLTDLSQSTISAIASDLLDEKIMRQAGQGEATPARRGRPQVAIELNPEAASAVCVYLSFNNLSAALVDYCGRVIERQDTRLSTLDVGQRELMDLAASTIRSLIGNRDNVLRVVLAVQGITDSDGHELLWSPITPHNHVPFGPALEEIFGLPVIVQNDCNMIAAALRWHDPQRYGDNFAAILLSDGIGMGLMLNGRLFTGTHSSGGEFGHMIHEPNGALCRCGRQGCIEAYAGTYAIWRKAHGRSPMEEPVADTEPEHMGALARCARSGDERALEAFNEAGQAIGFGIGSLFALVDPAPIVIVGQGTTAMDILEPAIRRALARTAGGQDAVDIPIETEREEIPLVQHGCAMTALTGIDNDIFGPAQRAETNAARSVTRKSVA